MSVKNEGTQVVSDDVKKPLNLYHPLKPAEVKEARRLMAPLVPFDEMYSKAWEQIEAMGDDDLKDLWTAMETVSDVNCGWTMFAVAKTFRSDVRYLMTKRGMFAA